MDQRSTTRTSGCKFQSKSVQSIWFIALGLKENGSIHHNQRCFDLHVFPQCYHYHDSCFVIVHHCSVTGSSRTMLLFLKAVSGLSDRHSASLGQSAALLSGCVCCQSVRMNLSPLLTDADADAQRKRSGAGKTRFCVSGSHVMKSVCPPKLLWIRL